MERFWNWLALDAGKHAVYVTIAGLLLTVVLGFGMTRLAFVTGQDSYLNSGDQVAIDNVPYQDFFGGQAILVLLTMPEGQTVSDLLSLDNQDQMQRSPRATRPDPGAPTSVTPNVPWRGATTSSRDHPTATSWPTPRTA